MNNFRDTLIIYSKMHEAELEDEALRINYVYNKMMMYGLRIAAESEEFLIKAMTMKSPVWNVCVPIMDDDGCPMQLGIEIDVAQLQARIQEVLELEGGELLHELGFFD